MILVKRLSRLPYWLLATILLGIVFLWIMLSRGDYRVILGAVSKGVGTTVYVTLIAFILAGSMQAKVNQAQSLALTVLIADTVVAVIALGLAVQVRKAFGSLDMKELSELKR